MQLGQGASAKEMRTADEQGRRLDKMRISLCSAKRKINAVIVTASL